MQGNRYTYNQIKDDNGETFEVRTEHRLTVLETKMNAIIFISGSTFVAFVSAIVLHVI